MCPITPINQNLQQNVLNKQQQQQNQNQNQINQQNISQIQGKQGIQQQHQNQQQNQQNINNDNNSTQQDKLQDISYEIKEKWEELGRNIVLGKKLVQEENDILSNILEMGKNTPNPQKFFDLFEALYMEIQMRAEDKCQVFQNIEKIYLQSQEKFQKQQSIIVDLQKKIQQYEKISQTKNLRQAGKYKQNNNKQTSSDSSHGEQEINDIYDWEVDIDLITNIAKQGWGVTLSPSAYDDIKDDFLSVKKTEAQYGSTNSNDDSRIENAQLLEQKTQNIDKQTKNNSSKWGGATVAVVGLYDKGKTFVLNNLTQSSLPSGKKCTTKGVSFKSVNVEQGTNLILVDTAGSYSPVKIESELSIVEKETTENFLQDLVFEISDYFICVVNDFTSLDQRYLDKISRSLQNSTTKTFREIIVIHNLKEVESQEILEHVWENQVTQIYSDGRIQNTKVASYDFNSDKLVEKQVIWFKTQYTRHVCIVNDDCKLGRQLNPWVFSLLRYWLKSVFVPVNRNFSVINSILSFSALKLSNYFKTSLSLTIEDTDNKLIKKIKTQNNYENENIKIPQITIDSSGLVNSRPDSFTPSVDIIANDRYYIYMDVPGLNTNDIQIYRQNVISVVKGNKRKPYQDQYKKLEKNERKYGEFTLSFRIPEIYERKWKSYTVKDGVLCIEYEKDNDESFQTQNQQKILKEQNQIQNLQQNIENDKQQQLQEQTNLENQQSQNVNNITQNSDN